MASRGSHGPTWGSHRPRGIPEGRPAEEVRLALEGLNAGRLRVATKGVDRSEGTGSPLVPVAEPDQVARGLYMLGWNGEQLSAANALPGMLQTHAATTSLFAWLAVYPPPS